MSKVIRCSKIDWCDLGVGDMVFCNNDAFIVYGVNGTHFSATIFNLNKPMSNMRHVYWTRTGGKMSDYGWLFVISRC